LISFLTVFNRVNGISVTVNSAVYVQTFLLTLVRLIMTGYIVAGKNNGEYKYGGIAEKPPNLTHHN